MIAIIDYGVGNLFSLASSLKSLGLETKVTRDAAAIRHGGHDAGGRGRRAHAVEGPRAVFRCQLRSVMADHVLTDLKGPDQAVIRAFPGFREAGLKVAVSISVYQRVVELTPNNI